MSNEKNVKQEDSSLINLPPADYPAGLSYLSPEDANFVRGFNKPQTPVTVQMIMDSHKEFSKNLEEDHKKAQEDKEFTDLLTQAPPGVQMFMNYHKQFSKHLEEDHKKAQEERKKAQEDKEFTDEVLKMTKKPDGAIRHDQDKTRVDLLSPIGLMGMAKVMTHGLKKYDEGQWRKGMKWSKVYGSLFRHLLKFMAGEDYDFDPNCEGCKNKDCKDHSGLPHVDSIATNAMFLQEYFRKHKNLDDREKTGLE